MPKVVDHDERRRELAAATWRVIVRNGIDATTTREIAREAGYSTGVLAHYYQSKDDLLHGALELSHQGIRERFARILAAAGGLPALRAYVLDNVPLTGQHELETRLEVSFWGRALVNDELRAVQRRESAELRQTVRDLVVEAQERGELRPGDPDAMTETLIALIDGLSLHALLYPERTSPQRMTSLMDTQLAAWAPGPADSSDPSRPPVPDGPVTPVTPVGSDGPAGRDRLEEATSRRRDRGTAPTRARSSGTTRP
jgi:AcrR family transcriptional regulator